MVVKLESIVFAPKLFELQYLKILMKNAIFYLFPWDELVKLTVAKVANFLVSDDAAYLNGVILPIDGGQSI